STPGKSKSTKVKSTKTKLAKSKVGEGAPANDPPHGSNTGTAKAATSNNKAVVGNVRLTHPDRVYWTDAGVTKRGLAEYYVGVWDWMAPHVVGRPLALLRCPDGAAGQCFFQKHIAANIKNSPLRRDVAAKEHDVIVIANLDDLVLLAQSG